MCGITGFAGRTADLTEQDLARMNATLSHRGPDEGGTFIDDGVGLAMRRLSILDLEGSHQPLSSSDGDVVVVFNGEIYNFRQLRKRLEEKGHRFRTAGDTEVLIHLYQEFGEDLVDHLRGMFAFALYDRSRSRLLLARDRLGIKPLFYSIRDGRLVFGSEIKALLSSGRVGTEIDWQSIDEYLAFTYIPAPRTVYREISKLPPGHMLVFEDGRCRTREYWDVSFDRPGSGSADTVEHAAVKAKIVDAVESHLVSDVPIGAFLSGGVDSSLVVAIMSERTSRPVTTFTMGFEGANLGIRDERPYAKLLGDSYDIQYHDFTVAPKLPEIMGEVLDAFDEPFADDSVVPTYYISKLTAQHVKVALSGLGGDELFGGYHRYRGMLLAQQLDRLPKWMRTGVLRPLMGLLPEPRGGSDLVDHLKRFADASGLTPARRYLRYVSSLDEEARLRLYREGTKASVDVEQTASVITTPFDRHSDAGLLNQVLYTDLKTYLPDDILALSDRLSMWHSLELRVPLIDHELTELAMRVPAREKVSSRQTKILLRRLAREWLPASIVDHRKQGFESPMGAWLRSDLKEYARRILLEPSERVREHFDLEEVERLFQDHMQGKRKNSKILFSLLILFSWFERLDS